MLAAKAEWSYTEYALSWLHGARMLLQTGTTTVADIEAVPELLPEIWDATPLRVFSFLEMTGVRSRRLPSEILQQAVDKCNSLAHPRCRTALSPHAPYSTSLELLRLCSETAREKPFLVATHVAESIQEFDMFSHARGEMFQWLLRNGRNMEDCGLGSAVRHMDRAGLLGEHFIGVHLNCLAPGDAELLGHRRAHVVHCPRSHEYFRHPPFPRQPLADAGVNLCLGTDSLATVRRIEKEEIELDLFAEMRAFSRAHRVPAETILQMVTLGGARALNMAGQIGELSENAFADLIAIPFAGKKADIFEAVLHHPSTVSASMINGRWAIAP
ncbi:MAG TPA: amidohydrolase family protein, partial [Verrucomicrobiae bacterium]|nr:amidohydrolase family protein [Verrucomicrobiae bacterium]